MKAQAPLHVGIVTETYAPEVNGVARTLQRLTHGLIERGHRVELVRPRQGRGDSEPAGTLVPGFAIPGYRTLHLGLPAGPQLEELWASRKPDVLYVATEGPLGWSAIGWARRRNVPVVSGFHTNFHRYSRHYGFGLFTNVVLRYLRQLHNRCAATVVPTAALQRELAHGGFERLEVLGRGVDGALFTPQRRSTTLHARWGIGPSDPLVLYVGRLAPEKNLPLALEAFDAIRQVNARARMLIVGDGPLAPARGPAGDGVIYCGYQQDQALAEHYAAADLFLFPSESETFGNVVLEAMASGLAVLAFDYAGPQTLIRSGHNGFLARPGDNEHFVALARTLVSRDLRQLRTEARNSAVKYDWNRIVVQFESLLQRYSRG